MAAATALDDNLSLWPKELFFRTITNSSQGGVLMILFQCK